MPPFFAFESRKYVCSTADACIYFSYSCMSRIRLQLSTSQPTKPISKQATNQQTNKKTNTDSLFFLSNSMKCIYLALQKPRCISHELTKIVTTGVQPNKARETGSCTKLLPCELNVQCNHPVPRACCCYFACTLCISKILLTQHPSNILFFPRDTPHCRWHAWCGSPLKVSNA